MVRRREVVVCTGVSFTEAGFTMTEPRNQADRSSSTSNRSSASALSVTSFTSGTNVLLGVWLTVSPWVLNYSEQDNAAWNQVIIGLAIAVMALVRTASPANFSELSWTNFVLGAWLIVAPFVLPLSETSPSEPVYWNNVIVGVLVLILAAVSTMASGNRGDPIAS